ncbi:hypothetical protein PSTT_05496, partial [Puccinia striiformis]
RDEHENKHRPAGKNGVKLKSKNNNSRVRSKSILICLFFYDHSINQQQTAGNKQPNPAASLFAGALAGSIEGFVTYPTEFIKTRSQFRSSTTVGKPPGPIEILKSTVARDGVKGLYSGCSALVIVMDLKQDYEKFKKALVDQDWTKIVISGLGAGISNASETIKTKLVNESMKSNPRFTGLIKARKRSLKTEGLPGIYRGLFPVMMRQGANSAVRFSTYSSLKALFQGNVRSGQQLPSFMTFVIGGVAGVVTVYCTMPLDVIKTRMQSLEAKTKYVNSFDCGYQIFKFEGVSRFWKGTTPRLIRLSLSGGIVFTVYENLIKLMGGLSV